MFRQRNGPPAGHRALRNHVPARWGAEHPPVLAAELGRAFVPDPERRLRRVQPFAQHQPPRLLQAQPLLVLQRAQARHRLEVLVEPRQAHPRLPGERLDPERVREVVPQPPDRAGDSLGRCPGRGDLPQPRPCGPVSTR